MTADTIRGAKGAHPFRPFDLVLVDGTTYTITHPDWIAIAPHPRPREVIFYTGMNEDDYRMRWIDLNLIREIVVPSESMAKPEGNGA